MKPALNIGRFIALGASPRTQLQAFLRSHRLPLPLSCIRTCAVTHDCVCDYWEAWRCGQKAERGQQNRRTPHRAVALARAWGVRTQRPRLYSGLSSCLRLKGACGCRNTPEVPVSAHANIRVT